MKDFLIDVPVKINIWIRPDLQEKQWKVIKEVRPSILFIQSDGGRNDDEWKKINQNRLMIDNSIDWNCSVYRLYETENNGMYNMAKKMNMLIWSKVDRCIFTEDDQLPTKSFFKFCAEMLERYKNDTRIECVCGFNHLGIYDRVNSDYFFSRQGAIWGFATWKRSHENRRFDYSNDSYTYKLLIHNTRKNKEARRQLINYASKEYYNRHPAGGEFWFENHAYSQNTLQIIPKYNLIKNIGATSDGEHSNDLKYMPKALKKLYNMEIYELSFPIKHNDYVIPDFYYEKRRNRIMGKGHFFVTLYRRLVRCFKMIIHGDFRSLSKLIKRVNRKEN